MESASSEFKNTTVLPMSLAYAAIGIVPNCMHFQFT